ncbi:MAG: branched-chain amino acid ABC transporter permease, partial [Deltaproteobacteria bacterium]|nr:branched-chain amino acid ABC transporter permease [Deltaproteobacteria bacterium]
MRRSKRLLGAVCLILICLVLLPLKVSDYYVSVLMDILMWIALVESWIILSGFVGYISLGHSAFFGLGGYLMAMTWTQIPYSLAILLAGLVSSGFAFVIGFPFLRVRGPYFVILTLGLTEITKYIFINLEITLGGTVGRILMNTPGLHTLYYSMLIVAILATATAWFIKNSRFGTALFSIKNDEDAAGSLGINASFHKWRAFGASAFFPGMVGAILALRRSYIDPYTVFDPMVSFQVIVMASLGGVEDVEGAMLGAVMLTLVSEALWANYPYYYMIIIGFIMIVVVKYMPMGLL